MSPAMQTWGIWVSDSHRQSATCTPHRNMMNDLNMGTINSSHVKTTEFWGILVLEKPRIRHTIRSHPFVKPFFSRGRGSNDRLRKLRLLAGISDLSGKIGNDPKPPTTKSRDLVVSVVWFRVPFRRLFRKPRAGHTKKAVFQMLAVSPSSPNFKKVYIVAIHKA